MTIAYIGLGSNLGACKQHIESAIEAMNSLPNTEVLAVSSLYKSKPMGPQDQPDYINAVAQINTEYKALDLLSHLQQIEAQHGRIRNGERWGARPLDLDILLYGTETIQEQQLTVPHVEMMRRAFVLVPLAELEPDCDIPGKGTVKHYLNDLDRDGLVALI